MSQYKRVLLKLSGESLMGKGQYGIDPDKLNEYASQICAITKSGIQVAIVIGGGNIFRGMSGTKKGFDRVKGDQMGMLATVINSIALETAITAHGIKARVFTAIRMEPVGELYKTDNVIDSLQRGEVAILAGGTGNPFFTTDSASALRAIEIKADVLLKGTRVDGVYDSDPEKNPKAKKFDTLSFDKAYAMGLKIMDLTAFTLCKENNLPILVFNMDCPGTLEKVMKGTKKTGTIVTLK
ncbi:MAG: UMP kinase [Bacteroidetes bacterium HGW-Bacteroidetes-21]|jgi:uridylate kinase|nr:MAG: UMP kinase [Bacteroidetes bacterium HGW-Bacteroidetes-21]